MPARRRTTASALCVVALAACPAACSERAAERDAGGVGGSTTSSAVGAGGALGAGGTGAGGVDAGRDASDADGGHLVIAGCDATSPPTRFISCVVSFDPGPGAGFGQAEFPDIIYGPPVGGGADMGSVNVLTLGGGGVIVVGFGGNAIIDGPGVDFIVFENAFDIDGDANDPYAEPGVVSVSEDGVTWVDFPCHSTGFPYTGCAGWHPVYSNPDNDVSPFDPSTAGGDAFDLSAIGVTRARFVRIRDVSFRGGAPTEGFDLDAIAIVNPATP